ncbi:hypothetical protein Tsubulata_038895 [Turnera subulata]|uniref:Indole-3-acetic acid-amido synthetase GH3.6 n=1 Tax=Turnera subulata TaxID=218843 RepID=A0A9Q0JB28_9ROSI|nr:hypothetical protein Tsubulata_038895 [Turnera subulata]
MADEELLQRLEESTKKAIDHQLITLQSILLHQAAVSYLRPYLSGQLPPFDASTFRRQVPLSSYDDYADHINNLANSGANLGSLLSVDPLLCFFYSSGTSTMRPKLIPYFDSAPSRAASYIAHQGSTAILQKLFPPRPDVNKILWFLYADDVTTTPGGFKVMGASTYPLQNKENSLQRLLASPREVIFGKDIEHQMYCHLLCALGESDLIDGIQSAYACGLVRAFGMLESKWEQLCDDLENGFPSLEISDASMRESVGKVLGGPRVDFSRRIRMICEKQKNWGGIVSKLWPNVRYVKCVTTGSMKQYYSKIKYYAGDVMVLGGDYFASECVVGINLDISEPPETTRFVMLPTAAYFEFLPFDSDRSSATAAAGPEETVDFSGVEEGKMYELVVTTHRGLYRYRLGDIVRVVGFHNSSPLIEFVMRAPKSASDVVTERDLMSAVESFQLEMRNAMELEVVEYSSFLESDTRPKQLKVFIEIEKFLFLQEEELQESVEALKMCCSSLENYLGVVYKVQRDRDEIAPLLVSVVKPGSFDRILQVATKNGAPAGQYKPPKIIRNQGIVSLLEASSLLTISQDS